MFFLIDRFLQSQWEEKISNIWLSILKYKKLSNNSVVVEIGPGISAKIGIALSKLSFSGTLYVIDKCQHSLFLIEKKYRKILPNANLCFINQDIFHLKNEIVEKVDFLLASHVIDDMVIDYSIQQKNPEQRKNILQWCLKKSYSRKISNDFLNHWYSLNSQDLNHIQNYVMLSILDLFKIINPNQIILSQYPSATLAENGLNDINKITSLIVDDLKRTLQSCLINDQIAQDLLKNIDNYNNHHIRDNILNAENWILYSKKNEQ